MAVVVLQFEVAESNVSAFIARIRATALEFQSSVRCPSLSLVGDLRCELAKDHGGNRHKNGTTSWNRDSDGIEARIVVLERGTSPLRLVVSRVTDKDVWLKYESGADAGCYDRATFWSRFRAA